MALTKAQLEWTRRAYSPKGVLFCHFPLYSEARGWYYCGSRKSVQIHHIKPQGFMKRILRVSPDYPHNLIALCAYNHVGKGYSGSLDHYGDVVPVVHTDAAYAFRRYGQEKGVFERVFEGRRNRDVYWNSDFDVALQQICDLVMNHYLLNHKHDDPWPVRRKR